MQILIGISTHHPQHALPVTSNDQRDISAVRLLHNIPKCQKEHSEIKAVGLFCKIWHGSIEVG